MFPVLELFVDVVWAFTRLILMCFAVAIGAMATGVVMGFAAYWMGVALQLLGG